MASRDQSSKRGLLGRVLGRGQRIKGIYSGDVRNNERVSIEADATVSGDVIAPQVTVSGLVRGRIVAHSLLIESDGQVLGDVWVDSLQQKSGGAIRGWVSSLTPSLAAVLQAGDHIPDHLAKSPVEEAAGISHSISLEALRSELADALLARKTIERELQGRIALATAESEKRAAQLEVTLTEAQETGQQLNASLSATEQRERTLSRALLDAQNREKALKSAVANLEEALETMTGRRDEAAALGVEQRRTIASLESKLDNHQQRIARLIDDLARAHELSGERHRNIERLEAELEAIRSEKQGIMDELGEQLTAARREIQDRDELLEDLGDNLVQSQEHVEQQHWDLVSARKEIEGLSSQLAELQAQSEGAVAAQQSAESSLQRQESDILRLKTELDVALAESDQDRAELIQVRKRYEEQAEKIASLQARLADEAGARRGLEQLEQQLAQARRLAEAQRTLAETRAATLADLQAEVERLNRQQRRLEAELSAGQGRSVSLEERLSTGQKRTAELEANLQATNDRAANLQEETDRKMGQFRKVLGAARDKAAEMQMELERAQMDYVLAQEQAVAWQTEADRLEKELAATAATGTYEKEELQTELNLAKSVIAELNNDIAQLEDYLEARGQTVAQLYADLAEAQSKLTIVGQSAGELQETSQTRVERIEELEEQLAAERAELQHKKQQLADLLTWAERTGAFRKGKTKPLAGGPQ